MNYYIADMHFDHKNCLKYDNRPFENIEEMNQTLIANWNNKVQPEDDIWILGDFCYRSDKDPSHYLKQLKGRKHLIVGNHDKATVESESACKYLESIDKLKYLKDGKANIILCHFPITDWQGKHRGSYHVYGHIHAITNEPYEFMSKMENALNAGCMINGFEPVTLQELMKNNKAFKVNNRMALERKLMGTYLPTYMQKECCWGVDTLHGVEVGSVDYVAEEFCLDGVIYHYHDQNSQEYPNHEHGFNCVIEAVIRDPKNFSINGFEEEYSFQERRVLMNLKSALLQVKKNNKPLSSE